MKQWRLSVSNQSDGGAKAMYSEYMTKTYPQVKNRSSVSSLRLVAITCLLYHACCNLALVLKELGHHLIPNGIWYSLTTTYPQKLLPLFCSRFPLTLRLLKVSIEDTTDADSSRYYFTNSWKIYKILIRCSLAQRYPFRKFSPWELLI